MGEAQVQPKSSEVREAGSLPLSYSYQKMQQQCPDIPLMGGKLVELTPTGEGFGQLAGHTGVMGRSLRSASRNR